MSIVKLNNKAVSNATAFGSISSLGSMVFIKKLTASSSATLSFVNGTDGVVLDDTYKEYVFYWFNSHPSVDGTRLQFNLSTDSGSTYAVTKTTTSFRAFHDEADTDSALSYQTGNDLAQSTGFQDLSDYNGNENDEASSGYLHLFNPSSTTFVKHFIANVNSVQNSNYSMNTFVAGYGNTTSAVNAIRFQMSSGNIDAGDICLYGIA
jgi:hypothetical protein